MRRDREDELDLADIEGETDAAAHGEWIASPRASRALTRASGILGFECKPGYRVATLSLGNVPAASVSSRRIGRSFPLTDRLS
jgi:hypothetical protein